MVLLNTQLHFAIGLWVMALEELVADRNIEGIQKFYQEVCTDTVDVKECNH